MKKFKENDKSLVYIINEKYQILNLNKPLIDKVGSHIGKVCYKIINNQKAPCPNCPLLSSTDGETLFYNEKIGEIFSCNVTNIPYDRADAYIITHNPIYGKLESFYSSHSYMDSFDAVIEIDFVNDKYKLLADIKGLGMPVDGKFTSYIKFIGENVIDEIDYINYKKFIHPEKLKEKIIQSGNAGVKIEFRSATIEVNSDWLHLEFYSIDKKCNKALGYIKLVQLDELKNYALSEDVKRNTLTGLLDGTVYLSYISNYVQNNNSYLVSLDIEHFKLFNELYGAGQGDRYLADIGKKLLDFDTKYETISGYFGGDNFAIVLPQDDNLLLKIEETLVGVAKTYGDGIGFMPLLGVYRTNQDENISLSSMYDRASIAIGRIKNNYINKISFFTPDMLEFIDDEYRIVHEVIKGIDNKEFTFYLQPKYNMVNNKVFGAEALVRWPKNGVIIPPNKYIPILEKTGSITILDKYVWECVAKWQRSIIDRGLKPIPVSVNVSRLDLYNMNVAEFFLDLIKKYEIPASLIEIEITESAYVDRFDTITKMVSDLRMEGFKILIDDFGTGYSSLNILKNLHFDVLKLDIKFLDITEGKNDKGINILESVVNMVKSINLPIIAEGVETDRQMETLKDMGCRYAQGYLFYKPMPIADFEKLITNDKVDYSEIFSKKVQQIKFRDFLNDKIYSDTLVNNILGAVVFLSFDGANVEILSVNEHSARIFGDEFVVNPDLNKNIQSYFHKDDIPLLFELLQTAYNNPIQGASGVVRYYKGEELLHISTNTFFLNEENGKKIYYIKCTDVTEKVDKDLEIDNLNKRFITTLQMEGIDAWELDLETNTLTIFNPNKLISRIVKGNKLYNFPYCLKENNVFTQAEVDTLERYIKRIYEGYYDDRLYLELPFNIKNRKIWMKVQGRAIKEDNVPIMLVGSYHDITEIRNEYDSEANSKTIDILRNSSEFSAYVNLTHNIVYSTTKDNDTSLIEGDYNVFKGILANMLVSIDNADNVMELISSNTLIKLFNNDQNYVTYDFTKKIDNQTYYKKLSIYMYEKHDEILSYIFISDIKAFNEKMKQLNNLNTSFHKLNCGVITFDKETNELIDLNLAALSLFECENKEEFKNKFINGMFNAIIDEDKESIIEHTNTLINPGDTCSIEYRILLNDGSIKYLFGNEILLEDDDGRLIIQRAVMDNTEQKSIELELKHVNLLKELEAIKFTNENKAILMGINKLFASSCFCDMTNNTYISMKHSNVIDDLISISPTYDEYMINYANKFVYSDDKDAFVLKTSRKHIKEKLCDDNDVLEFTYRRILDNEIRWYKISIIPSIFDEHGNIENFIFAVNDVNYEFEKRTAYKNLIDYYKRLLITASEGVYLTMYLVDLESLEFKKIIIGDKDLKEEKTNDTWHNVFASVVRRACVEYKNEIINNLSVDNLRSLNVGDSISIRYKIDMGIDEEKFYWISTVIKIMEQDGRRFATIFSTDITDDVISLENAKQKSIIDPMTGLYNRHKFLEYKKEKVDYRGAWAVLFLDINDLKIVNDTLGHEYGDILIKTVSKSINAVCNDYITGYRYGGDEFIIIAENISIDQTQALVSLLHRLFVEYNEIASVKCSVSIGYSYSLGNKNLEQLLFEADKNMYQIKMEHKRK